MNLRYRVHSANPTPITIKALAGGEEIEARVLGLEVELVPVDHAGGSLTIRARRESAKGRMETVELFPVGALIDATFAKVEG